MESISVSTRSTKEFFHALPWIPKPYSQYAKVEPPSEYIPLLLDLLDPVKGVPVQDRGFLKIVPLCFVGKELVQWLMRYHRTQNPDFTEYSSISLAQKFLECRIFAPIDPELISFEDAKFYRFQIAQEELLQPKEEESAPSQLNMNTLYVKLKDPKMGVGLSDKSFLGVTFRDVFKGSELVEWLRENLRVSDSQAKELGQHLLQDQFISHCSTDLLPFTTVCFYRFVK